MKLKVAFNYIKKIEFRNKNSMFEMNVFHKKSIFEKKNKNFKIFEA